VYQLLDRVTVPELVTSIVDSQVRPYCDRHKLNVDVVLLNYVKVRTCDVYWLYMLGFIGCVAIETGESDEVCIRVCIGEENCSISKVY